MSFAGKRVWIVGASSGIGHAVAQKLLAQGAVVGLTARSRQPLDDLARQYPRAIVLPADITQPDQLAQAYQAFTQDAALNVYIHCAAAYQPMRATNMDSAKLLDIMHINYDGVIHGLQQCLPQFLARQAGHIAIIASVAGYMGLPKSLAYGPSKAALINLTESLYVDLEPIGIKVQLINPGFVETPLTKDNDFQMPALISADQAADAIIAGLNSTAFEITFPKRFTWTLKFVQRLPYILRLHILRKIAQQSSS